MSIPTRCPHCQEMQFGGLVCTKCGRILLSNYVIKPEPTQDPTREEMIAYSDPRVRMFGNIIVTRDEAALPNFRENLKARMENLENSIHAWIETNWND